MEKQPIYQVKISGSGTAPQIAESLSEFSKILRQSHAIEPGNVYQWQDANLVAKFRLKPDEEPQPPAPEETQVETPPEATEEK